MDGAHFPRRQLGRRNGQHRKDHPLRANNCVWRLDQCSRCPPVSLDRCGGALPDVSSAWQESSQNARQNLARTWGCIRHVILLVRHQRARLHERRKFATVGRSARRPPEGRARRTSSPSPAAPAPRPPPPRGAASAARPCTGQSSNDGARQVACYIALGLPVRPIAVGGPFLSNPAR